MDKKRVAVVSGVRTPFGKAGGALKNWSADMLGVAVVKELLMTLPADLTRGVDEVIFGNVAGPANAMNIARVIALNAGICKSVPAFTVHRNCASGMEAVTNAFVRISGGFGKRYLVGGTESMSHIPLLFNEGFKGFFEAIFKAKTPMQKLCVLKTFKLAYLKPEIGLVLGLTDPTNGLIMGKTAENLARDFDISRKEQDEFAVRSHNLAENATKSGVFKNEILPLCANFDKGTMLAEDEGIRNGQNMEALVKLPPYFEKPHGTVTVGNSSQITDGAVGLFLMDETQAKEMGLNILGYVKNFAYSGCEPSRMGLGPVFAIRKVLADSQMCLGDIDLFEINEAFAVQALACVKAMGSKTFADIHFDGMTMGEIPLEKLNPNGGAVALGHPVGASGARIILHALNELKRRGLSTAIASLCIGGGQGGAVILERE
jgi:acetyl-CoA acetyltransferase family protein